MRFEAKHSYFKRIAGVVRNFKNIEKTIAIIQAWETNILLYMG